MKSTAETQTALCIAGAHRSGTSMVTRLLHCCGLELGPESELMPQQADNPDGFWEHLGFVALNDELLNELGGAWDLPPKTDENFTQARLDPLRDKARLLIESFDSARVWGWKDPRNSLTLPFWQKLLHGLKTVIVVRNPLEVAHSMRRRNGTSYSFGLRLWEIYNRRLIETAKNQQRLVTHYDLFFEDPESELRRITHFAGLPDANVKSTAALINRRRRHTRFTLDELIVARVSAEVIDLYRALIAEANQGSKALRRKDDKRKTTEARQPAQTPESDLLPGSVSRLKAFVPEHSAEIQQLRERFAETEARHKTEIEDLCAHYTEEIEKICGGYEAELKRVTAEQAKMRDGYEAELQRLKAERERIRDGYEAELKRLSAEQAPLKIELAQLHDHFLETRSLLDNKSTELAQLRDHFVETSTLLHRKSVSLAEDERLVLALSERLRKELWAVRKLSRLLDDVEKAANCLRSSRRWGLANPLTAIRAKLFPGSVSIGYGHLEKVVAGYAKWKAAHPEIAKIEEEIHALRRPVATVDAERGLEPSTQKVEASGLPIPVLPVESICFPTYQEVEVSIIIPVFNQCQYTHACVASLQTAQEPVRFEVIVVDDCSTDDTAELVPQMGGVVYLRNETNSGFIASCNRGAQAARGKYLVFLNNDTVVKLGWLTALLDTFTEQRRAGVVGSKLVYPDGRLQEAGGIIWQDASGWNYGKFDDPQKPEYNYLRDVDYCSAAALMIPKVLFESVGRFDSRYGPAYYEDTDLAFKVRKAGYKVLYQPLSEIVHYEGATGGTDLTTGAKKHQEINRSTFAEAWGEELLTRPVNGDLRFLQQRPTDRKSILVIDHHLPMPDKDSGSLRMFQILKILRQLGHRITFVPDNLADIPPYTGELQKRGIEVIYHPYIKSVREYLAVHGSKFDVVLLSRCDFARKHMLDVRLHAPQSRIIFDTVDLHFLREHREAQLTGDPEAKYKAQEKQRLEHELIERADETWVVSSVEQQLLQKEWPHASIQVVSNIVDIPGSRTAFALRRGWLFIGSFLHRPNIDAVLFFVEKIYPLVSQRLRDAKFYIIGDKAPPEVVALADENIVVAGLQRDVGQFFDSVKLSVAPLRYGAGVKGKINQSMAFGVPVVATSVAVEGMGLTDHEDVLVADEPEGFARALIELYESEEVWNPLSENGIRKTKERYSVEAAQERLSHLFSDRHLRSLSAPSRPQSSRGYVQSMH
jgi:GT2 family glycosyltransferase/glycosyltransferase involved in cell wall biosynthesis